MEYNAETNQWVKKGDVAVKEVKLTRCPKCGQDSVLYRQEAYGDSWKCQQDTDCNYSNYYSLGD